MKGSDVPKIDVRMVAATNRDLKKAVKEGIFREDLYYRINVVPITLAPLRQRQEDIPLLVNHFLEKYSKEINPKVKSISEEALELLTSYPWPGNFRELEQCVRNVLVRNSYHPPVVRRAGFLAEMQRRFEETSLTIDELTSLYATWTYSRTSNHAETARRLGIDQRTAKKKVDDTLLDAIKGSD